MNLLTHLFLPVKITISIHIRSHSTFIFSCLFQMRGEAEAFAVEAKGRAEAEQMAKKADAFKQYKEGAMVDMLLEKLPLVSASDLLNVSK